MKAELRHDAFTGTDVVIAAHRKGLVTRTPGGLPVLASPCPFCPGNEAETEATLQAAPSEGPWLTRVVRNKYPLTLEHELVIESPDHDADLWSYNDDELTRVLAVVRDRVTAIMSRAGVKSLFVFRNRGRKAGSSQPHPHTQICGLDSVPRARRTRTELAHAHHSATGTTLLATEAERAVREGRCVAEAASHSVFVPFATHRSFETWVAPRGNTPFWSLSADGVRALAESLGNALRRVRIASGDADYNVILHLPEPHEAELASAFWYVEIAPRFGGNGAGFELSTGSDVVTTTPEEAAETLRTATR